MLELFPRGFRLERRRANGIALNVCYDAAPSTARPALLLLHGFPQTHAIWHRVAERLRRSFTLVMPDLRGYGDSDKPDGRRIIRRTASARWRSTCSTLMRELGYEQFFVCGHDRGGRVAHRLALDHSAAVRALVLLDISPTLTMYERTTMEFARSYYHWFFLIQPAPLPETLIGAAPSFYLRTKLGGWGSEGLSLFDARALAEYERCFADPRAIHAMCEDYRAAATIDLAHDRADAARRIDCPAPRAVGRARRRAPAVHAARGLASEMRARGHGPGAADGPLHPRGSAGPARRGARSILCTRRCER